MNTTTTHPPTPSPRLLRLLFVENCVAPPSEMRRVLEEETRTLLLPHLLPAFDVVRDGHKALTLAKYTPYNAIFLSSSLREISANALAANFSQMKEMENVPLILMAPPRRKEKEDHQQLADRGYSALVKWPLSLEGVTGVLKALFLGEEEKGEKGEKEKGEEKKGEEKEPYSREDWGPVIELPEYKDLVSGAATLTVLPATTVAGGGGGGGGLGAIAAASMLGQTTAAAVTPAAASGWRPPQLLRLPISDAMMGQRQPQMPRNTPPKKAGWCVGKRGQQKKRSFTRKGKRKQAGEEGLNLAGAMLSETKAAVEAAIPAPPAARTAILPAGAQGEGVREASTDVAGKIPLSDIPTAAAAVGVAAAQGEEVREAFSAMPSAAAAPPAAAAVGEQMAAAAAPGTQGEEVREPLIALDTMLLSETAAAAGAGAGTEAGGAALWTIEPSPFLLPI